MRLFKIVINLTALIALLFLYQNCGSFEGMSLETLNSNSDFESSSPSQTDSTKNNDAKSKLILDCETRDTSLKKTDLARLTRKEIFLSLIDIVGFNDHSLTSLLPIDAKNDKGFNNESSQQNLSINDGQKYFNFFEQVIDSVIAEKNSKVFNCDINSNSCLESIIDNVSYLAHRGLSTSVSQIKTNLSQFNTAEEKLKWSLMTIFLSPEFLFHQSTFENISNQNLSGFQVADRLASLLWFSNPDKTLLDAAKNGELSSENHILAQIDRMLVDHRIERFIYNFSEEWLSLSLGREVLKQNENISSELTENLINESKDLLRHVLKNDLPIKELFTADYSFMNNAVKSYYGLSTSGNETKTSLSSERNGVFTHAAVIAGMSGPGETNPTHRGYWFLKRAFCLPPDPIPGELMNLVDNTNLDSSLPMKERLAVLSKSQACASCHLQMDPIGIAFENFNAFGQLRTHNGPHPVDTSSEHISGIQFANFTELAVKMEALPVYNFENCFTHHLVSLARSKIAQKELLCETKKLITHENMTFKEIVRKLATSDYIRK